MKNVMHNATKCLTGVCSLHDHPLFKLNRGSLRALCLQYAQSCGFGVCPSLLCCISVLTYGKKAFLHLERIFMPWLGGCFMTPVVILREELIASYLVHKWWDQTCHPPPSFHHKHAITQGSVPSEMSQWELPCSTKKSSRSSTVSLCDWVACHHLWINRLPLNLAAYLLSSIPISTKSAFCMLMSVLSLPISSLLNDCLLFRGIL